MHHLYGITERMPQAARLPSAGVDDGRVLARRIGGLTVLSTLVERPVHATRITLSRHLDVQMAAAVPGPLFPVPFGVTLATHAIEPWLALRAGTIRAGLRLLKGRVEMRVSVLAVHVEHASAAQLCAVADRVAAASGVTSWRSRTTGTGSSATITLGFLVRTGEVSSFLARIAPVAARAGNVAVVPSGPWPATSFTPPLDAPAVGHVDGAAIPRAV